MSKCQLYWNADEEGRLRRQADQVQFIRKTIKLLLTFKKKKKSNCNCYSWTQTIRQCFPELSLTLLYSLLSPLCSSSSIINLSVDQQERRILQKDRSLMQNSANTRKRDRFWLKILLKVTGAEVKTWCNITTDATSEKVHVMMCVHHILTQIYPGYLAW